MLAIDPVKRRYAGMVSISLDTCELGGWLAPGYRSQGLGAELFSAAGRLTRGQPCRAAREAAKR
jgi:hypothetical protein